MSSATVLLPSAIAIHQLRSVLASTQLFPLEAPTHFTLSFHPKKTYMDPLGVVLLAAWASFWHDRGVTIDVANLSSSGLVYAERMGLLAHLGVSLPQVVTPHDESGRFVALTHIRTQSDLSALCADIGGVLRVPHLIEFVQYVLAELVRNVLEHAQSTAFVCAQYYSKDKRVTIGVADCGRGIKAALRTTYGFPTDHGAILASLRPGVSGVTGTPYSAPDNAGLGLFYARGVAKASARPFVLLSGTAAYRQLASRVATVPARNPEDEAHSMLEVPAWQGTAVGMNIRGFDANLQSFMARVKPLLNVGETMQRIPPLNFT